MIRWLAFEEWLTDVNRFVPHDQDYVKLLLHRCRESVIDLPAGTELFRARAPSVEEETETEPFPVGECGMAPAEKVRGSRLNPARIPVFYAAMDPNTAVAEVRPWRNARVSVGRFEARGVMRVVDLRMESVAKLGDADIETLSHMLSRPVGHEDDKAYLPSQYLGQLLKAEKYDGVLFDSSLNPGGVNVALFYSSGLRDRDSELREVTAIRITSSVVTGPQPDA